MISQLHILPFIIAAVVIFDFLTGPTTWAEAPLAAPQALSVGEGFKNPLGSYDATPMFSWQLPAESGGLGQSAFRIVVATSPDLLMDLPDLWDSGKVESDQSVYVKYQGPEIASRQKLYWAVMYWDQRGKPSAWSETANMEMGLLDNQDWSANWIGFRPREGDEAANDAGKSDREGVYYFRRELSLKKPVTKARLYVTSRGLHQVYLNDERVGDDELVPGWTKYDARIETLTYDVTDLLMDGENALGAAVGRGWYAGRIGWQHDKSFLGREPQLLLQLELTHADGTSETLVSDDQWKSTDNGPIRSSSIYDGEAYDATREMPGWAAAGFDDSGWGPVTAEPIAETPKLAPKRFPPVRAMEQLQVKAITQPEPGRYVFDLGQNMVGRARITMPVREGQTITIRFAEMLKPDGSLYTENYRSAKSTDYYTAARSETISWEPTLTFHGFRYVELSGFSQPVTPQKDWVTGVVLRTALEQIGQFASSHDKLNQLQSNITWGQRGNFVDIPTDCPQRDERLGWTGDAQTFCSTSMFNFDTHAFWCSWLQTMRAEQQPDGGIPHVIPNVLGNDSSPGWGDAAIIVPWELYLRTGDRQVLEDNYDMMKKWVGWYESKSKDGISTATGFGDWLQPYPSPEADGNSGDTPQALIATAYHAYGAGVLEKTANILGKNDDAAKYGKEREQITTALAKQFFDNDGRLTTRHPTQTGYVLPLGLGLFSGKLQRQAQTHLAELIAQADHHLGTGFIGTSLLNRTLDEAGRTDLAYQVLFTESYPSWFYSIDQGATTIWERWNSYSHADGFGPVEMNSFNHYAYGAVGQWMYERIAGLAPDPAQPGYKHFFIQPAPGGPLTSASAKLETPYGAAESSWHFVDDRLEMNALVPPNTTATVVFPVGQAPQITMNGKPLAESEIGDSLAANIEGKTTVEVPAGAYRFSISPAAP